MALRTVMIVSLECSLFMYDINIMSLFVSCSNVTPWYRLLIRTMPDLIDEIQKKYLSLFFLLSLTP